MPIYLLASQNIYDENITKAGYVYVGDIGPDVQIREFTPEDLKTKKKEIVDLLSLAENSSFENYTSRKHCKWCSHNDLPCSEY